MLCRRHSGSEARVGTFSVSDDGQEVAYVEFLYGSELVLVENPFRQQTGEADNSMMTP
jgi:hypothetical protein